MAIQHEDTGGFREWLNQGAGRAIAIVLALGVAALAGWLIYRGVSTPTTSDQRKALKAGRTVLFVCKNPACGASGKMKVGYGVEWPQVCEKCKQNTAVKGVQCRNCPAIIEETYAPLLQCPKCRFTHDRRGTLLRDPNPPPVPK